MLKEALTILKGSVYPILARMGPKLLDYLAEGKPLNLITLADLASELDKNKLERIAVEEKAKRRVGL